MFKYVHHVCYNITNRDMMVAYMDRTFGMRPDKLLDQEGSPKEAQYRVGQILIRMCEPVPGTERARWLEKRGPGVYHVSWGVDNAPEVAQELKARGVTLRHETGHHQSPLGYYVIDIDLKDSHGVLFQLAGQLK